ncbi:radical SAM protein [bacterium]|nr:radical SAM protein [bacterium]
MSENECHYSEDELNLLKNCVVCPWQCGVDRTTSRLGVCNTGHLPVVSSYNLHFGEEPPISGYKGSGTIFLTNCNMKCIYCQNYPISQYGNGEEVSLHRLAEMMLMLQSRGAHNINFVTPTHQVVQIKRAILCARDMGLEIPIVYNSSGYDSVRQLESLKGLIDIYLVDMRYGDNKIAKKYSGIDNYVEVNQDALLEMHRQVGDLMLDDHGIAKKGIIIRHLVLPNGLSGSKEILEFIRYKLSKDTYISMMSQYFPAYQAPDNPNLNRRIKKKEYDSVLRIMESLGLERGWVQDI